MRHKAPIWGLWRWEPPEYIKEEKWYKLEVEGCELLGEHQVSDHGRVFSSMSESILAQYMNNNNNSQEVAKLRVRTTGKQIKYTYVIQRKFRELIKLQKLKPGDTLVYPLSTTAKNKMKRTCPDPVVSAPVNPEAPAAGNAELSATGDKRVAAFPEPHHQELPWMKITPEELTVVRMMLASLEDHEAVHVVQAARRGLKRLLDEEERHSAGGLSTDG